MTTAAIGLGSNVGDRLGFLRRAVACLDEANLKVTTKSSVFETPPFGVTVQPRFLNAAVLVQFEYDAGSLLAALKNIEHRLGRNERVRWGPREIDLDILMIPGFACRGEKLEIPHPGMADRAFVLLPLAEIAPDWIHPILQARISALAERFNFEARTFRRITRL